MAAISRAIIEPLMSPGSEAASRVEAAARKLVEEMDRARALGLFCRVRVALDDTTVDVWRPQKMTETYIWPGGLRRSASEEKERIVIRSGGGCSVVADRKRSAILVSRTIASARRRRA